MGSSDSAVQTQIGLHCQLIIPVIIPFGLLYISNYSKPFCCLLKFLTSTLALPSHSQQVTLSYNLQSIQEHTLWPKPRFCCDFIRTLDEQDTIFYPYHPLSKRKLEESRRGRVGSFTRSCDSGANISPLYYYEREALVGLFAASLCLWEKSFLGKRAN